MDKIVACVLFLLIATNSINSVDRQEFRQQGKSILKQSSGGDSGAAAATEDHDDDSDFSYLEEGDDQSDEKLPALLAIVAAAWALYVRMIYPT